MNDVTYELIKAGKKMQIIKRDLRNSEIKECEMYLAQWISNIAKINSFMRKEENK